MQFHRAVAAIVLALALGALLWTTAGSQRSSAKARTQVEFKQERENPFKGLRLKAFEENDVFDTGELGDLVEPEGDDDASEDTAGQAGGEQSDVTNNSNSSSKLNESAGAKSRTPPPEDIARHFNIFTGPEYGPAKSTFEYYDGPPIPPWWEMAQMTTEYPNCDLRRWRYVWDDNEKEDWEELRSAEIAERVANKTMTQRDAEAAQIPRIYDVFLMNTELDLLELRLNELAPLVDKFVIVDSKWTFTHLPKNSSITKELINTRYKDFAGMIVHITLEELPGEDTWARERFSRTASLERAVAAVSPLPGDVFITGDLDELPRPSVLNALKRCKGWGNLRTLRTRFYYYSFESRADFDWPGPSIHRHFPKGHASYADAEIIRETVQRGPDGIFEGGWHCSWCLATLAAFSSKMGEYSHEEHNTPHYTDHAHILSSILLRRDLIDRDRHNYLPLRVPVSPNDRKGEDETMVDLPPWLATTRPPHLVYLWDRWKWAEESGLHPDEVVKRNHTEFEAFERAERERWAKEEEDRKRWEEEEKKRKEEREKTKDEAASQLALAEDTVADKELTMTVLTTTVKAKVVPAPTRTNAAVKVAEKRQTIVPPLPTTATDGADENTA